MNRLIKLKSSIDDAKIKKAKLEGKLGTLHDTLETQYGFTSVEEAEENVRATQDEISGLESELSDGMKALEEKYDW